MSTAVRPRRTWGTASFESLLGFRPSGAVGAGGLAYALTGPAGAPVVLVLGGISAHRDPSDALGEGVGWWPEIVRPGGAIDLDSCRVLSIDYLGGRGESARAATDEGGGVRCVTTVDQAHAIAGLFDLLAIDGPVDVVGASYGGMVAMQLAALHPEHVRHLLVISAAHRTHPMATALRSVQRAVLRLAGGAGFPETGVQIARGLGIATYRTREEFDGRFDVDADWSSGSPRFPVEEYLTHVGRRDAEVLAPDALYCLSASADAHALAPEALRRPTTAVAVVEDTLVPPELLHELAARHGGSCRLIEVHSRYGHDAFLKETGLVSEVVTCFLSEVDR